MGSDRIIDATLIAIYAAVFIAFGFVWHAMNEYERVLIKGQMREIPAGWHEEEPEQAPPPMLKMAMLPPPELSPEGRPWSFWVWDTTDCVTWGQKTTEPVYCVAIPRMKRYMRKF